MNARTIVLASLVATAAACGGGRWTATAFAERGDRYAAAGQYEAAVIEYRNAIKREPGRADAHRKLADALMELGNAEAAYRSYSEACTLAPADTHSCVHVARLLLNAGLPGEAQARAQAIVDRAPNDVDALLVLASALSATGRFTQTIQMLGRAIAIDHRPAAYATLGDVQANAGDIGAAEAAFRTAVDRAPASSEARTNLARFLIRTGRPAAAESELLEAVRLTPHEELPNRVLASLYVTTDRAKEAEVYFKRAAAVPKQEYRSLLALADFYAAARRWDEAREVLKQAPAEGVVATSANVRLAAIEYETGDPEAAHGMLDTILKQHPSAEAWTLQAQILARERRPDEALEAARAALALQPRLPDAYRIIAAVERQRGNRRQADDALRVAERYTTTP